MNRNLHLVWACLSKGLLHRGLRDHEGGLFSWVLGGDVNMSWSQVHICNSPFRCLSLPVSKLRLHVSAPGSMRESHFISDWSASSYRLASIWSHCSLHWADQSVSLSFWEWACFWSSTPWWLWPIHHESLIKVMLRIVSFWGFWRIKEIYTRGTEGSGEEKRRDCGIQIGRKHGHWTRW